MARDAAAAIGAAIRRAREQRGLTQGEMASALGRTQSAVSFWEQGRRTPDIEDLIELVRRFGVEVDDLFAATAHTEPIKVVLRHQAERVYQDEFAETLELFMEEAERHAPPPHEIGIANDSPVGAALELLAKAGLTSPAVPVHDIARRCGMRVIGYAFTDGISGLLLELETGPVIGFNSNEHPVRQRFTIAHELGHHLLRHYDNFHIDPTRTAGDGHPPGYDWKDERAANDFAAQLLMPATWVSAQAKELGQTRQLATAFEVSEQAMNYRLVNLGLR